MKKLLFIVGFRAVGKSTVGRLLARKLDYDFHDTDYLICRQLGMSIDAIVQNEGWQGFRAHEQTILEHTSRLDQAVVSTGGGAVLHQKAWGNIGQVADVIWLQADQEAIISRITQDQLSKSQRPSLTEKDLSQEVKDTLKERLPLYKAVADYVVDTGMLTPEEVVEQIVTWRIEQGKQVG